MNPFAAVLLAGGRSRRMGRDKALLPLPDGRLLWRRQLEVLRELGPAELFISGPARKDFPADVPLLQDAVPDHGPLAGISSALTAMHSSRLVVLAVDLPEITTGFLRRLLAENPTRGIIPQAADGFFEPLAAVYPHAARTVAEQLLNGDARSLQTFARRLLENGQVIAHPLTDRETALFTNWNAPGDFFAPNLSNQ